MKDRTDNFHLDALPRLADGVHKAAMIVARTMGPRGENVIIEASIAPFSRTTNDGATIIKALELADPIEKIGLGYLKEAVERSNNNSGDGSSTTSVILDAILQGGLKTGSNNLELKRSLDECLPLIEESIRTQTKQITVEEVISVARIAGENEVLAQALSDIYKQVGKDGIVHLDNSDSYETSFSTIDGIRFVDTGFLSPYMAYDEQAEKDGKKPTKAIYKNPQILVTKNKITKVQDIDPILQFLIAKEEKALVIFTDDMDSNVARGLIEFQKNEKRPINILIIKAPTLWKSYVFEDFAKITGATIIEDASGTALGSKFKIEWLGTCETLICDKEETTVIGIKDIQQHIAELEADGSRDAKLRLSWLTTKTAILKLGAKSETELTYLRDKATDAIFSCRSALKNGVVAGAGVALASIALHTKCLPDTIGGNILKIALKQPMLQILANAGKSIENIVLEHGNPVAMVNEWERVYDVVSDKLVMAHEAGIVDSSDIVLGAVKNALGIASTILTASSVVLLPPVSQEELMNKSMMRPAYL